MTISPTALVIGSGFGGLAAALRAQHARDRGVALALRRPVGRVQGADGLPAAEAARGRRRGAARQEPVSRGR